MKTTPVKSEELCIGDVVHINGAGPVEIISINKVTRVLYEMVLVSDTANNKNYHRSNGGSIRWCRRGKELEKIILQ